MRIVTRLLITLFASTLASNLASATPPSSPPSTDRGPGAGIAELRDQIDPAEGERSLLRPDSEALAEEMNRLHREEASERPQLNPAAEPMPWEQPELVQPAQYEEVQHPKWHREDKPPQPTKPQWSAHPGNSGWPAPNDFESNPKRLLLDTAHALEKMAHKLELAELPGEADKLRRVAGDIRKQGRKLKKNRQRHAAPAPPPHPGHPFFPGPRRGPKDRPPQRQ